MPRNDLKPLTTLSAKDITRFWMKVDKSGGPDACWPWKGYLAEGYGRFHIRDDPPRYGHQVPAARVAIFLQTGVDIAPLFACHSCDTRYRPGDMSYRKCCNPTHLWAGTVAENNADAAAKGRSAKGDRNGSRKYPERLPRGDQHPNHIHPERLANGDRCWKAKLTADQVRQIRELYASGTVTQAALGLRFNVTRLAIHFIVVGKNWKHIL